MSFRKLFTMASNGPMNSQHPKHKWTQSSMATASVVVCEQRLDPACLRDLPIDLTTPHLSLCNVACLALMRPHQPLFQASIERLPGEATSQARLV